MSLTVVGSQYVKDGTQIWMKGAEVLDITTTERAAFFAMFGLMQVPVRHADKVMISQHDYDALKAKAPSGSEQR